MTTPTPPAAEPLDLDAIRARFDLTDVQCGNATEYLNRLYAASRDVPALIAEVDRLKREGSPGVMHEVDRAFYQLVVTERDHARVQASNFAHQRDEARQERDAARQDAEQAQAALDDALLLLRLIRSTLIAIAKGERVRMTVDEAARRITDFVDVTTAAPVSAAAVPCDDATHTHCTDVHCGCGCHDGERFDPFLRRWTAAVPQTSSEQGCVEVEADSEGQRWCTRTGQYVGPDHNDADCRFWQNAEAHDEVRALNDVASTQDAPADSEAGRG